MESRLAESQHALAVLPQSHQAPRENGERRAAAQEAMPRLLHDPMTTNTHPKVTSGTPRGGGHHRWTSWPHTARARPKWSIPTGTGSKPLPPVPGIFATAPTPPSDPPDDYDGPEDGDDDDVEYIEVEEESNPPNEDGDEEWVLRALP